MNPLIPNSSRGFTFIELLTATIMFSIIIAAMYSVFFAALRMRDKAYSKFEKESPRLYVASIIRRDFMCLIPQGGLFSGAILGENNEQNGFRADTIEFNTASASIQDETPWGDVQKVEYYLQSPLLNLVVEDARATQAQGLNLIRAATRNLLPTEEVLPEEEILLRNVQSLEFGYYDGESWVDEWDGSTDTESALKAISMRVAFAGSGPEMDSAILPIHLVVPVLIESGTTESTDSSSSEAQGQDTGGGGGQPAGGSTGGPPQGQEGPMP